MDILIDVGIGPIRFGMTPAEIDAVFPEPHTYEDWMGGNLNGCMLYHGLLFGFDRHTSAWRPPADARLVEITVVGREDARLLGRPVGDWTQGELATALTAAGHRTARVESGDLNVIGGPWAELSFEDGGRLCWVRLEGRPTP